MFGICFVCYADGIEDGSQNTDGVTVPSEQPVLEGADKIILTVDQYGNPSSTNAIAMSADLAAISASNRLAMAIQDANADGYRTATNLMNEVAKAVATSPIIFSSVEITSFVAATVFDDATSKMRIFKWIVENSVTDTKSIVINGTPTDVECIRITCGYMFTSDISTLSPVVKYSDHMENSPSDDWNFLNAGLVEAPTVVVHEPFVDGAGNRFTDFYEMHFWVPADRAAGFFRVVVENSTASAEGNTLDTVGVKDGYTAVVTNGTMVLNIKGGYIMANGTMQLEPTE